MNPSEQHLVVLYEYCCYAATRTGGAHKESTQTPKQVPEKEPKTNGKHVKNTKKNVSKKKKCIVGSKKKGTKQSEIGNRKKNCQKTQKKGGGKEKEARRKGEIPAQKYNDLWYCVIPNIPVDFAPVSSYRTWW